MSDVEHWHDFQSSTVITHHLPSPNNGLANYFQNLCKSGVLFLGLNLDTIVFGYCILGSLNELNYMIVLTNALKKKKKVIFF